MISLSIVRKLPKVFLVEGDELDTIETTASFFSTELISFVGDSGVTILSVLNADLLSDDEDEPIHRR